LYGRKEKGEKRMIPRLHIQLLHYQLKAFQFFGVLGYVIAVLVCGLVALATGLLPQIILLLWITGGITFFLLAMIIKWIKGQEDIVYYHQEIGILSMCAFILWIIREPILPYLDVTILGIGVFLVFGRLGCYSIGCCHGKPAKKGVKYSQIFVDAGFTYFYKDVPLLPVQIWESIFVLFISISSIVLLLAGMVPGSNLIFYTTAYGLFRFCIEYFRGDPERPAFLGLSEAQWTSILLILSSFILAQLEILPAYELHLFTIILLVILAIGAITFYLNSDFLKLTSPQHLKQISNKLRNIESAQKSMRANQKIRVFTTTKGLSISAGTFDKNFRHYSISTPRKTPLSSELIEYLAKFIQLARHRTCSFEIIKKTAWLHHIIFFNAKNTKKNLPKNI